MTPGETVTAFVSALERKDFATCTSLCGSDLVFENVPLNPPIQRGRGPILAGLEHLVRNCTLVEWTIGSQIEQGDVVMNERVDRFVFADGTDLRVPVAGVWTVKDGLIEHWRDYYDFAMWQQGLEGRSWAEFAASLA